MTQPTQEAYIQEMSIRRSASWFYWIAGMSVINMIALMTNMKLQFVVGLGSAQFITSFFSAMNLTVAGIILGIIVSGIFGVFGYFANQKQKWAFILGLALYAGDLLLCLACQDYMMVAFHAYAGFCIFNGLKLLFQNTNG